jgi:hypothetical protein
LIPDRGSNYFALCNRVQTGSEDHPPFYSVVTGVKGQGVKLITHILLVQRLKLQGAIP